MSHDIPTGRRYALDDIHIGEVAEQLKTSDRHPCHFCFSKICFHTAHA